MSQGGPAGSKEHVRSIFSQWQNHGMTINNCTNDGLPYFDDTRMQYAEMGGGGGHGVISAAATNMDTSTLHE